MLYKTGNPPLLAEFRYKASIQKRRLAPDAMLIMSHSHLPLKAWGQLPKDIQQGHGVSSARTGHQYFGFLRQ